MHLAWHFLLNAFVETSRQSKNALDDADIGDLEGILSFSHCPAMRVMTDFK